MKRLTPLEQRECLLRVEAIQARARLYQQAIRDGAYVDDSVIDRLGEDLLAEVDLVMNHAAARVKEKDR